jgi:endoglucanase
MKREEHSGWGPAPPDETAVMARAVLARYAVSKWDMAQGQPAGGGLAALDGDALRAVPDSGFSAHPMDMLNWVSEQDARTGAMAPPRLRTLRGHRCADHTAPNTWGLWCRQADTPNGLQAHSRNRMPYRLEDPHFAIVALSVPATTHTGVAFQASHAKAAHVAELRLCGNRPQAHWHDPEGQQVLLTAPAPLAAGQPAVLTLASQPGLQVLRVNGREGARSARRLAGGSLGQLLVGWGFVRYFPRTGFGGHVFSVLTGRGAPDETELRALERYAAASAGLVL